MYNSGKVWIGILIFIGFFTIPFWLNLGRVQALPKPELPKDSQKCIEDVNYMRAYHMKFLEDWRTRRIREGKPLKNQEEMYTMSFQKVCLDCHYINKEGKAYVRSLQKTCMKCHTNKEKFCDRCHQVVVSFPDCWNCHIAPEEVKNGS